MAGRKKEGRPKAALVAERTSPVVEEAAFAEVLGLIEHARRRSYEAANTELIDLYWRVGGYISAKLASAEWGDGVVADLAGYLARNQPGVRGFSRQNLFRMRQFHDAYADGAVVSALLRQLPWTHHLIILGQTKSPDEREFYMRLAIQERWSSRELERQLRAALFERAALNPPAASAQIAHAHPEALGVFKDSYVLEFLELPDSHSEADLHRGLLRSLKHFITELGRDFCFVGSETPIQVGGRDFSLDLLFYHRGLKCLVAIELKAGPFEPEHLGKLEFYLEALDRDVRKPHEGPSIGLLLCATKDSEVVEYALARSSSPTLIAEYQRMLPDKALLRAKLHEFYRLLVNASPGTREPIES